MIEGAEGEMKTERKRDTAEGRGSGEWQGGGRSRSMRNERREGGGREGESVSPSTLFLTQRELQYVVNVRVGANKMIFSFLYLKSLQVMLSI